MNLVHICASGSERVKPMCFASNFGANLGGFSSILSLFFMYLFQTEQLWITWIFSKALIYLVSTAAFIIYMYVQHYFFSAILHMMIKYQYFTTRWHIKQHCLLPETHKTMVLCISAFTWKSTSGSTHCIKIPWTFDCINCPCPPFAFLQNTHSPCFSFGRSIIFL